MCIVSLQCFCCNAACLAAQQGFCHHALAMIIVECPGEDHLCSASVLQFAPWATSTPALHAEPAPESLPPFRPTSLALPAPLDCMRRAGLVPLNGQVTALQALVHRISANEDLAELSASAAAAQQTVEALAQRQAAALEDIREELLASPEILRCVGCACGLGWRRAGMGAVVLAVVGVEVHEACGMCFTGVAEGQLVCCCGVCSLSCLASAADGLPGGKGFWQPSSPSAQVSKPPLHKQPCVQLHQDAHSPQSACRQGGMARWVMGQGRWQDCHCVLTRAGFLHCLPDIDEPLPQDTIALGHTAFITGDAPEFQLIEALPARVAVFSRERGAIPDQVLMPDGCGCT